MLIDWRPHFKCNLVDLMVEMDQILRPEGTVVVRDAPEVIDKVACLARAARWTATIHEKEPESDGRGKILVANKNFWALSQHPTETDWYVHCNVASSSLFKYCNIAFLYPSFLSLLKTKMSSQCIK